MKNNIIGDVITIKKRKRKGKEVKKKKKIAGEGERKYCWRE